jgi:hypothetical protein
MMLKAMAARKAIPNVVRPMLRFMTFLLVGFFGFWEASQPSSNVSLLLSNAPFLREGDQTPDKKKAA